MSEHKILVVRPAWRREWRGFMFIGLLLVAMFNLDLAAYYLAKPIYMIESALQMRINWLLWLRSILLAFIVITLIQIAFRHYRHKYKITQDGVAHIIGILGREERPLQFQSITLATKKQGPLEYLFNLGSVSLFSSGTDRADVIITGVTAPKKLLDRIQVGMRHASEQS